MDGDIQALPKVLQHVSMNVVPHSQLEPFRCSALTAPAALVECCDTHGPQPNSPEFSRIRSAQHLSLIQMSPAPGSYNIKASCSLISSLLLCKKFSCLLFCTLSNPDLGWEMKAEASQGPRAPQAVLGKLSSQPMMAKKENSPEWIIALWDSQH